MSEYSFPWDWPKYQSLSRDELINEILKADKYLDKPRPSASMDCMIDEVEKVQQHRLYLKASLKDIVIRQMSEAPEPATDHVSAIDTLTEGLVGISVVVHEFQKDINEINQRLDRIQEIIKHNHAVCENTQIKIGISWKRLCKNIRENFLNR